MHTDRQNLATVFQLQDHCVSSSKVTDKAYSLKELLSIFIMQTVFYVTINIE